MSFLRLLGFALFMGLVAVAQPARAQVAIGISIDVVPPPLPVYPQPIIPGPGYIWVPGYWAWSNEVGYYWVPGTWVLPPQVGLLWTPGYWGWNNGLYVFNAGYWGPHIGFYGGVNYGYGYGGVGYEGGYWRQGHFFYNSSVNNFGGTHITNVYNKTVVVNNSNVSFNGGAGGTAARATPAELAVARERHVAATPEQTRNREAAAKDPSLSLAQNHGHPTIAATSRAGEFKGAGVVAAKPGPAIEARPSNLRPIRNGVNGNPAEGNKIENSNQGNRLERNNQNTQERRLNTPSATGPTTTPNANNPQTPGTPRLENRRANTNANGQGGNGQPGNMQGPNRGQRQVIHQAQPRPVQPRPNPQVRRGPPPGKQCQGEHCR